MKKGRESSARSRELGAELAKRRKKARYTTSDLARQLGWSASKVSRMESGERGQSEVDVAVYLAFCGVLREDLDVLLAMARETDDGTWLQPHGERLPDELRTLVFQETTATIIHSLELNRVPGLFQTEAYARALLRAGLVAEDGIEARVRARMDRQGLLRRLDPPTLDFFIHEQGLRLPVGSRAVVHEQMLQLVFLTSRPQTRIRVVPIAAGPHPGLAGPFMLMRYAQHAPLVYVENQTTSLFLETWEHVETYRKILAGLAEMALDDGQSREFFATLASEYDQPEGGAR